jgi:redox-sensing transcriptional repressor
VAPAVTRTTSARQFGAPVEPADAEAVDPLRTPGGKDIPEATIARLPVYLRALNALTDRGTDTVSSGALAEAAGVNSAQLRKDLSYLGSYGTRGVGYDVAYLRFQIGREVGSAHRWPVVIVGLGNLGTALANYSGFTSRGFRVVAMVDPSPDLVGKRIHGVAISDLTELEEVVRATGAAIAVLATPAEGAQQVCDRLVAVGVTSSLNFASAVLVVPEGINVRKVDLGQELQILAYHEQRKSEDPSHVYAPSTSLAATASMPPTTSMQGERRMTP